MVPKIHPKGHSFRGAATYLLHDIGADTSERVAWTETRNLATDDPHTAWRVMAATAMNSAELKRRAGIKATGRKSNAHVLHMTLSWHPDESEELDRGEMLGSAEAAILALGAEEHQAMVVCHDDHEHPHVHVLINRVSPKDGRMLSSSFERLKASEWAQKYEEARGQIFCHERVINNKARKRGEYTRGKPDEPRHIFEIARQAIANDNPRKGSRPRKLGSDDPVVETVGRILEGSSAEPDAAAKIAAQRRKDREVGKRQRAMLERHAKQWRDLESAHRDRVKQIKADGRKAMTRAREDVQKQFRPRWVELHHEQQAELQAHQEREQTVIGRASNALRSIDFQGIMQSAERKRAISEAFRAFADRGTRLAAVMRTLEAKSRGLTAEQRRAEAVAVAEQRAVMSKELERNRRRFVTERADLILTQQLEQGPVRTEWTQRREERAREMNSEQHLEAGMKAPGQPGAAELPSLAKIFNDAAPDPLTDQSSDGEDERHRSAELLREQMKREREQRQRRHNTRDPKGRGPRRGR